MGKWASVDLPCFAYNFSHDGIGYYSFMSGKKEFTYTANENSVTIHYTGDLLPGTFEYVIEDDILSIQDSFGNYVKYKLIKEDDGK